MTTIRDRLKDVPEIHWHMSACDKKHEPVFRWMLERVKPTKILEIGTHHGVSAALMAEYAPVVTIDIFGSTVREKTWSALGVKDRIESHVCVSSQVRDATITKALKGVDLAFVDGGHLMPDVERDFALTIPCGNVLMHDYWASEKAWPDVRDFVDSLEGQYRITRKTPFALVQKR